jgi:hypothetical protein
MAPERMELLKQAKARIDTGVKIIPVAAAYGSPGRVLCFGSLPDFMCRVVPIRPENVDNIDSIEAALRAWFSPFAIPDTQWAEEFLLGAWMNAEIKLGWEENEHGPVFS